MCDKEEKMAYKLLYTFLKENGILANYVRNVIKKQRPQRKDAKSVLMEVIFNHKQGNYGETRNNLFNYAPSSFYWSDSLEGEKFWQPYLSKWENFFDNNKEIFDLK